MADPQPRSVISGVVCERPPETTRAPVVRSGFDSFVLFICRPLWGYRFELALLTAVLAFILVVTYLTGNIIIGLFLATATIVGLSAWPRSRQWLLELFSSRETIRSWDRACRYSLVVSMNDKTPKPLSIKATPAGHVMTVQMPPGLSTLPLDLETESLASNLSVMDVQVERERGRADRAEVRIIRRDPLADSQPLTWTNLKTERLSIWDPIPVGIDEMGEVINVTMTEKNIQIAGEPGGGKSVSQSQIVATAALDPDCDLYFFDANLVEFSFWRHCAQAFVGPDLEHASATLGRLETEMHRRYEVLMEGSKRKISRDDVMRPIVVVINELAHYLASEDSKTNKALAGQMRRLVAQGRAAGIIMVTATQKPSADVIPSYLRDLFAYRWALRCSTPQASDTILGAGWASRGYNAAEIDSANRGVGFLLAEGGTPKRIKSFYLSDDDLESIARRARALRSDDEAISVDGLDNAGGLGETGDGKEVRSGLQDNDKPGDDAKDNNKGDDDDGGSITELNPAA